MNRVSPQIRSLANRLTDFESGDVSAGMSIPADFNTIEKLRGYLSMLMGRTGCQALLSRALVLAIADVPWLSTLRVDQDGGMEGLTASRSAIGAAAFRDGENAILAHVLALLLAFIGPALALRLLKQLWPGLSFDEADFSETANDEDANPHG